MPKKIRVNKVKSMVIQNSNGATPLRLARRRNEFKDKETIQKNEKDREEMLAMKSIHVDHEQMESLISSIK